MRRESEGGEAWVVLEVRDTGIGIPKEKTAAIFDVFAQGDLSTSKLYGGTGLGLALTRRFCRLLGGDITMDSEVELGSKFTIRLPAQTRRSEVRPQSFGTPRGDHNNAVLVVDDDPSARELICRSLERDGIATIEAATGKAALELAKKLKPVAITLDVVMPEMDGWTALSALKANPELRNMPVVLTTVADDRALGYAVGEAHYLTKPIDRERLISILSSTALYARRATF